LVKQFFLGPCFDESVSSLKRGRLQNPQKMPFQLHASSRPILVPEKKTSSMPSIDDEFSNFLRMVDLLVPDGNDDIPNLEPGSVETSGVQDPHNQDSDSDSDSSDLPPPKPYFNRISGSMVMVDIEPTQSHLHHSLSEITLHRMSQSMKESLLAQHMSKSLPNMRQSYRSIHNRAVGHLMLDSVQGSGRDNRKESARTRVAEFDNLLGDL
jgi:hypothetical protein